MCATWATVGALFLDHTQRQGTELFPGLVEARHSWHPDPWLSHVPAGTEDECPEYYGRSLVKKLIAAHQEVGSHSFTHPVFGDPGCSPETAETELAFSVQAAKTLGLEMKSFVFPRNVAGHVGLLKKHGFTCWRGLEPVWYRDARVPGPISRIAHLADVATVGFPPTVLPHKDEHGLWVIPASTSLLPYEGVRKLIPVWNRVHRAQRCTRRAAADRKIAHFWFHPINLASSPKVLLAAVEAVLDDAARLRDAGKIEVLSMGQIAERMSALA